MLSNKAAGGREGLFLWPHILVKAVLTAESPSSDSPLQLSSPTHQVPSKCPSHKSPSAGLQQHGRYRLGADEQQGCSEQHRAWLQVSSTTIFVLSPFSVVLCSCESIFKPSIQNLKRFCIISVVLELGQSSINLLRAWGPADVARGVRKLLSCAEGYGPTPEPVGEWAELPASAPARAGQ